MITQTQIVGTFILIFLQCAICKLAQLLRFGVTLTQEWAHLVFLDMLDVVDILDIYEDNIWNTILQVWCFWSPSSCSIVMFFLHLKSCWNAELPQVSFFYIWEPVIVSKPGWASICALSTLLFLVCGPKKLLELPGIYGKSGDRRSNCIFILDCSPQPCSLALGPWFPKGRVVVQQSTLYDKGKVYCFYKESTDSAEQLCNKRNRWCTIVQLSE